MVTLAEPDALPQVEFVDIPARPMESLQPIDGAERSARDIADLVLARAGALDMPEAMVRAELRNTPRPLFRETDAIVRRETGDNAWLIRLTSPGEALDPLGRDAATGLADLHPVTLFDAFVSSKEASGEYEPAFAGAFRNRGKTALEQAITRLQEAGAAEGVA